MTAEQIRAAKFECDTGEWECARWLQEIAAQLADLNEAVKSVIAPDGRQVFRSNTVQNLDRIASALEGLERRS